MNLGPDKLDVEVIKKIIEEQKYKSIITQLELGQINWDHRGLKEIKLEIRKNLRMAQDGRCIYCRRKILPERRNVNEDIEHFLDKSKPQYRHLIISADNLALSCHACNIEKGTFDAGCSTPNNPCIPKNMQFKIIHPYYHSYHENIRIEGWVYSVKDNAPNPSEARELIEKLKLSEITQIETKKYNVAEYIRRAQALIPILMSKNKSETVTKLAMICKTLAEELQA